jgi:hypothetical protein
VEPERVIKSRKLSVTLTYQFGRDQLIYTLKDRTGELQFPVRYEVIDVPAPYKVTLKDRTTILYFGAAGFALIAGAAVLKYGSIATIFGLLGFAALFAGLASTSTGLFSTKNTMFKMAPPPTGAGSRALRVMEGAQHDDIVAELKTRWRDRLRRMHLAVNHTNDPKSEAAKFKWLKEREVISDGEYDAALAELHDADHHPGEPVLTASKRLN